MSIYLDTKEAILAKLESDLRDYTSTYDHHIKVACEYLKIENIFRAEENLQAANDAKIKARYIKILLDLIR